MRLKEIDIIRCLVTMMVVAVHILAPYTKAWNLPIGIEPNETLWWVGKFCYSGMLETFVFISGYVFAIKKSFVSNKEKLNFIFRKVKRLYLPCVVFGGIMSLIFSQTSIFESVLFILNGRYHLWFLPMLLWCFIIEVFIIDKLLDNKNTLLLLVFISVLPYPTLPLYLNNAFYYLLFFHLGVITFNNKDVIIDYIKSKLYIIIPLYCLLFIFYTIFRKYLFSQVLYDLHMKIILLFINHSLKMVSAILCVMIYYWLGCKLKEYVLIYNFAKNVAHYSMGIYLFQELVIRLIYYKTTICNGRDYPFLIFMYVFVFVISYLSTFLLTRNRYTRGLVV